MVLAVPGVVLSILGKYVPTIVAAYVLGRSRDEGLARYPAASSPATKKDSNTVEPVLKDTPEIRTPLY